MPITFIPFTAFQPDGGDYGPGLSVASNVLPIHGGWRALQGISKLCGVTETTCLGSYVHVYQQAQALEYLRPKTDYPGSNWTTNGGSLDDLYVCIDEEAPNDEDWIVIGNAPTAQPFQVRLTGPESAGAAANYYLRMRYRIPATTGAWTLDLLLKEGANTRATLAASGGAAATEWVTAEYALSAPEIAAIVKLEDLEFRFVATVPGTAQYARPTSDVTAGSWVNQAGSGANLYAAIDETSYSDSDYIRSTVLPLGGARSIYTAGLGSVTDPVAPKAQTGSMRIRATNSGVNATIRLLSGTDEIASWDYTGVGTSFSTKSLGITADAAASLDYANLRLTAEGYWATAATSTVSQYARPDSTVSATGNASTTSGDYYTVVDEVSPDDGDYFYSEAVAPYGFDVELGLSNLTDPLDGESHVLKARLAKLTSASATCNVYLYQGATQIAAMSTPTLTLSPTTYTYTLSAAEANAITDYTDLTIRVVTGDANVACFWLEFGVPEPRRLEVSWAEWPVPSPSRAEVSWAEMQIPNAKTGYLGDVPTVFAGSLTKLYEATRSAFTDLSKGGGYSASTYNPVSWSFCSWGNDVIATNYVDAVQYRANNTGAFADLITSTDKPKARFCAPFRNQLMLAGINLSSHYDDEIWISAVDNARSFARDRQTQSDYQRIVSCPGQITGLVGGDFALVFKRRSIHAIEWTGGPTVFRVRDLSSSIGTPYSRSIVACDGRYFFWGGDSFYVTDGLSAPQRIGSEVVSWYLTDAVYSSGSIVRSQPVSIADEDQVIVGSYDPAAGLIMWSYQKVGKTSWSHDDCLFYNPKDDRWSVGSGYSSQLPLASVCQMPNVSNADTHTLRGTVLFGMTGGSLYRAQFSSNETLAATLTSRRQTIGLEESERPQSIRITGILPAWSVKLDTGGSWPSLTVSATAANDQRMVIGATTQSYTSSDTNEAGWFPHDLAGAWWQFSVAIPQTLLAATVAFQGVYVRWEPRGRV